MHTPFSSNWLDALTLESPPSSQIATFVQKDKGSPISTCDKIGLNSISTSGQQRGSRGLNEGRKTGKSEFLGETQ